MRDIIFRARDGLGTATVVGGRGGRGTATVVGGRGGRGTATVVGGRGGRGGRGTATVVGGRGGRGGRGTATVVGGRGGQGGQGGQLLAHTAPEDDSKDYANVLEESIQSTEGLSTPPRDPPSASLTPETKLLLEEFKKCARSKYNK